ncbi:MAG: hypothetical protein ACF8NJ_02555 [Phycisphaerales bacterium JB038]
MTRKALLLATWAGLACFPAVSQADFACMRPIDNATGNLDPNYPSFDDEGWRTFDLIVFVDAGDDWTIASIDLQLLGGTFFQHGLGGDLEPPSALIDVFPALEFDSFFASPPALFDGINPQFVDGLHWTDSTVQALWFDTVDSGEGCFTLARFTTKANHLIGSVVLNFANSGGEIFPFDISWPPFGAWQLMADLDDDGDVDQGDLGLLLAAYDSQPGNPNWNADADIDDDGHVDQGDLGALLTLYGYTYCDCP